MATPVLEVRSLTVDLPAGADRPHAVEDASLILQEREILCVVGESGSGKSVLARAIMGLLPQPHVRVTSGQIDFGGEDLVRAAASRLRALRGDRLAMIFQEPMSALNPLMTIGRQIDEVVARHRPSPRRVRYAAILDMLAAMHLPDPERMMRSYPHQLSGGQRQRAMIAMALILEPAVLIADEPTTALDVTTQAQILRLIKEMQATRGTSVLFITHDFGVVAEVGQRVVVMNSGRVVESGEVDQVLGRPRHAYTRELIAAVPRLKPRPAILRGVVQPLLTARGIEKTFRIGGTLLGRGKRVVRALNDATITVGRGETLGVVGESGSGKSTLARSIARLVDCDAGEILLEGTDLRRLSRRHLRSHRRRFQMIFQDPFASLDPRQPVGSLISEGPRVHGVPAGLAMRRALDLLQLVGLDPRAADRYPHEFSGGQRQRIGIARALALEPELLIADEPVSALDVSVQAQILRLLADLRERLNLAMLFITHDLRVAAQVCDRIAVMQSGEVVETGAAGEVFSAPRHPYTRELLASVPGLAWEARFGGSDG